MSAELKDVIDKLGHAFEEFKAANDQQIKELKTGKAEAVLNDKVEKLSAALEELQEQKDAIEKKLNRPGFGSAEDQNEAKTVLQFNRELKAAAALRGDHTPADVTVEQFRQYKSGFLKMVRSGDNKLADEERKAMQVGIDSDGGILVPSDTTGRIVTKLYELSPIRSIANVITISSSGIEGIEDLDEAGAGWTTELGTRSDSDTPQVGKWTINAEEMYAQPKTTQKLLDDAAVDIEAWLAMKVADKFARTEGAAFINGTGVGQPRGFATYTTAATADSSRAWGQFEHVNTGANGAFHTTNADPLFDLIGAFKPGYLQGASWVTRREVLTAIRKFKSSVTGEYLWQPGLSAGQPAQLLNFPYIVAQDMPTLATGSLSMALGNFQIGYQIVDRIGIRVLRDPYTDKPYVKFYTTKRVGGGAVNFEAIKFVRFSA